MTSILDVREEAHFSWREDACLKALFAALNRDGDEVRVVGGAVRNSLLGLPIGDIDCATTALPSETMERGRQAGFKIVPTGLEHGTLTLVKDGQSYEVTSLRADVETDGRHAKVAFGRDWAEDAARRDFTMNALYLDADGQLYDHLGSGVADTKARRVRFIGKAEERIREDYLRILRFFRFYAQYGHAFHRTDYDACVALQDGMKQLSAERVGVEMIKLVQGEFGYYALEAMFDGGFLGQIGLKVPMIKRFGFYKSQSVALGIPQSSTGALMAVNGHCRESVEELMQAWRQPNRLRDALIKRSALLEQISTSDFQTAELQTLKQWAYRYGKDTVLDCLALQRLDRDGEDLRELCQHLQQWDLPTFPVKGKDLIAAGVTPGPEMGVRLSDCEARWVESGFRLGKAELLDGISSD